MALDKNEGKALNKVKIAQNGKKAATWGAQQAIAIAKDPQGYHRLTRALAEARLLFVTRWFWIAEYATLAILALFGVIEVVLLINQEWLLSLIFLIPILIVFLLWRLARYARRLLYRQIERALAAFDDLLAQGLMTISDWPRFFVDWRRKRKDKNQPAKA